MTQPNLEPLSNLRITSSQLERLTGIEVSELFVGRAIRWSLVRSPRRLVSFLVTELVTLGLLLMFCLPIGLVIGRGLGLLTADAGSTVRLLTVTVSISVGLFALWNSYLVWKSRQLRTLLHLVEDVDKHNEIVEAVSIMDELAAVQPAAVRLIDRDDILQALQATRESLICALMTEKILRKHQRFMTRRQALFAQIETNLATLHTLQVDRQASEYGQLLNEALQIGMSIRQEIEQWRSQG